MFYCKECADARLWPVTMFQSRGLCEMCGKTASCSDVPSSALPVPPQFAEAFADADRRLAEAARAHRYYLAEGDGPEQEVTRQQYVSAERAAGFYNTRGEPEEPATASFSGHAAGREVRGRTAHGQRASGGQR